MMTGARGSARSAEPRAGRGDVRAAILVLPGEGPMHGHQVIQELSERSGGMWRPSPGSVYPSKRVFRLTDAGTAEAAERTSGTPAPWEMGAENEPFAELPPPGRRRAQRRLTVDSGVSEQQHHAENISRDPGLFARVARRLTHLTGSPRAVVGVVVGLVIWITVGWWLGFPRAWELAATAGLPVLTLVLLIVVQHTQNHDDRAIQLKLDELIRALDQASDSMIQVDQGSWKDLEQVRENQAEGVRRRATEH